MDIIITELNEKHKALKLLESQMAQVFFGGGRDVIMFVMNPAS